MLRRRGVIRVEYDRAAQHRAGIAAFGFKHVRGIRPEKSASASNGAPAQVCHAPPSTRYITAALLVRFTN